MGARSKLHVVLLLAALFDAGVFAQVATRRYIGRPQGKLLIRDVASLSGQLDDILFYPISFPTTADACEARCKSVAGCNAWTVCDAKGKNGEPAGCGSGCIAWAKEHPGDRAGFVLGHCSSGECVPADGDSDPCFCIANLKLPVEAVGLYAGAYPDNQFRGCMPKCSPDQFEYNKEYGVYGQGYGCRGCTGYSCKNFIPSDQFAFGMCSLLQIAEPGKPTFMDAPLGVGWSSGTVILPKECAGLSAEACEKCAKAKDPAKCRSCWLGSKLTLNQQLGVGPSVQVQCTRGKSDTCFTSIGSTWEYRCGLITMKDLEDPKFGNTCVKGPGWSCKALAAPLPMISMSPGASISMGPAAAERGG